MHKATLQRDAGNLSTDSEVSRLTFSEVTGKWCIGSTGLGQMQVCLRLPLCARALAVAGDCSSPGDSVEPMGFLDLCGDVRPSGLLYLEGPIHAMETKADVSLIKRCEIVLK